MLPERWYWCLGKEDFIKVSITKATHIFFSKNISIYAIFNDQSFNDMLTNDIVSFEQLSPDIFAAEICFIQIFHLQSCLVRLYS